MRKVISTAVSALQPPSADARARALATWGSAEAHDRFQSSWPCLNTLELAPPQDAAPVPASLQIAAWNIERCKQVEASADLIARVGADIVLATEMDLGMARSGQRHTTRDLAERLGFGYAYGTEFVELGTGDDFETAQFAGVPNAHGLHGNALLSRWPLADVRLIPLDDGGGWFVTAPKNDGQYRVGGRMAMAAIVESAAGPLLIVSVHLESQGDAEGRAAEVARLLTSLDSLYGAVPAVVGGDFNTKGFLEAGVSPQHMLADPASVEPCFSHFERHGFAWRASNTGAATTRIPPWGNPSDLLKTLDWLFVRGVAAGAPAVHPALSADGDYLSDHELISAAVAP